MRLAALSVLVLLAACATKPAPQSNPLAGPTWVANEIAGQGVLPRHPATLDVRSDGSLSGESGCNGYAGAMTVAGETLSFGDLIATKKACPGEQMEQEARYFQALGAARRYLLDGVELRLLDEAGATLVLYRR
jgi:putative lipoprotein